MFQTELRRVVVLILVSLVPCTTSQLATAQWAAPSYPDIVEQIAHLQIQNEHQREMLRFSTTHINLGDGPLQIRGGGQVAPCVIDALLTRSARMQRRKYWTPIETSCTRSRPELHSFIRSTTTGIRVA